MVIQAKENLLGARAFLFGVVMALLVGVLSSSLGDLNEIILVVLVIIGFVVGFSFMNISNKEVNSFLVASVSLVIVSFAGAQGIQDISFLRIDIGQIISSTLKALLVMLVPATIIVSIKSMFSAAQK